MRLFSVCTLLGWAGLLGCNPTVEKSGSGQTGSVGPSADECDVAADCQAGVAAEVAAFGSPTTNPYVFDAAECASVGIVGGPNGPSCICSIVGGDGALSVGPVGLDCYRYGRAGDCLWPGDEFEGCDVNDPDGCDAVCAELGQRLTDDAARTFEASSVYAACEEHECHSVIEIEQRCFAERSYASGRAYDCSLGGESIVAAELAAMQPPELDERPESRSSYVEGTDGMVELTASSRFVGKFAYPPGFGAMAQFAIIGGGGSAFGEIVDPLDGIDDCGVFIGAGLGTAGTLDLYDAADVRLLDGSTARPFALSEASHDDFYSYILELDTQNVKPRFGASYGVHVSGGSFGAAFDSGSGLHLPQELAIHELQSAAHLEQTDLHLTWTGSGEQPLFVQLLVGPTLQGFFSNYEMQCLLKDDGEFVIPAEVLRAMPAGFASATFAREDRRIVKSGAHSLLLFGSVQATHRFALGPLCEKPEVVEACLENADATAREYAACNVPPPPLEEQCPDFLATACNGCPEYFACVAQQTRCTDGGLQVDSVGCACPVE